MNRENLSEDLLNPFPASKTSFKRKCELANARWAKYL